jgi:hypothetical protein
VGVIWVSGLSGSGSSSVAKWLAGTIKPCAYVDGITMATAIHAPTIEGQWRNNTQGLIDTGEEVDDGTFDHLRYRHSCLLANSFAEARINVVIDLQLSGDALRQEVLPELRSRPFYLVQLLPSERMVARTEGVNEDVWRERRERFRRQTPADGLWLDGSGSVNDREIVQRILANLEAARIAI